MTKVLIVDDEVDIWFLLSSLLRRHKLVTKFVNSLGAARQTMEENSYSLLFLDNHLPDGFGTDFVSYVKLNHSNTKIAMITGYEAASTKTIAYEAGVDFFLQKPFSTSDIEKVLQKITA